MKKVYKYWFGAICIGLATVSCSDFLDTKSPSYDSSGIYQTEAGLREGVVGVYSYSYMEGLINALHRPAVVTVDNFTGLSAERAQNTTIGAGGGMTSDQSNTGLYWSANYKLISRANAVLHDAKNNIDNMSADAHRYFDEARILRAFAYYNLCVAYGDVPFFTSPVTVDEFKASRTPRMEVLNYLLDELEEIASSDVLPWTSDVRGRLDRSCAYGLKARIALFAAGISEDESAKYYRMAANAANEVITKGGRRLAEHFDDLFTKLGQQKADVRSELIWELMYSDQVVNDNFKYHWVALGNGPRMFAQTGQHPTGILADTYECIDGLRIDESPLYNPQKPWENRDPRFKSTLKMHGDTLSWYSSVDGECKTILEAYAGQTKIWRSTNNRWIRIINPDISDTNAWTSFVKNGCGYIWFKYLGGLVENTSDVTSNIAVMRYAEILLSYAEAKIELGELDESVYDAINQVRNRSGMPDVSADRIGNQWKMRQLVRRERKVELAMEGLHFADMRRWKIGDLENAAPSYGTPNSEYKFEGMEPQDVPNYKISDRNDLNDIGSYDSYKHKLLVRDPERRWQENFYLWPLPQSELNKNPNLKQNPGYAQ